MEKSKPQKAGFDIDLIDIPGVTAPIGEKTPPSSEQKEPSPQFEKKADGQKPSSGDISDNPATEDSISDEEKDITIDNIFNTMKKKGNFPSFSHQIASVNKILKLKYASAKDIADVIGKDFALSQKLLRLVNSSFYGQFSKKGLTSITQAMIILGADCIQQAAASLMLFEMMHASSKTDELKNMTIGNFISGIIAKDLAKVKNFGDPESYLICSMFRNIGEYLTIFYFHEKYQEITDRMATENITKEKAARSVLGVTFQELGMGIAKKWNLPDYIIKSMEPIVQQETKKNASNEDMMRYISSFANEICRVAIQPEDSPQNKSLGDVLGEYRDFIDISDEEIESVLLKVSEKVREHAGNLKINVKKSNWIEKITPENLIKSLSTQTSPSEGKKKTVSESNIAEKIKQINQLLKTEYQVGDVLTQILDIMYTEFNFKRVAMGIKTVDNKKIIIRYARGEDSDTFKRKFSFKLEKSKDIFNTTLTDESDVIVHNSKSPANTSLVPEWYGKLNFANGFSLYPIIVNNIPFGVFYADSDSTKREDYTKFHSEMKKLRSLAVKALKTKSV